MRIPIYICLPLVLAAGLLTWWLRTKDMNFLSPEGYRLTYNLEQNQNITFTGPPEPIELALSQLGDPELLPAIDEYQAMRTSLDLLERAYAILSAEGKTERAYLAAERILEHPDATIARKVALCSYYAGLQYQPPLLLADTDAMKQLTIELSAPAAELEKIDSYQFSHLLEASSGRLVQIKFLKKEGDLPAATLKLSQFQGGTDLFLVKSQVNLPLSPVTLEQSLYTLLITAITQKNKELHFMPPSSAASQLLLHGITRHAWNQF